MRISNINIHKPFSYLKKGYKPNRIVFAPGILAVICLLLVGVVACGADTSNPAGTGTTSPAATTAAATTPSTTVTATTALTAASLASLSSPGPTSLATPKTLAAGTASANTNVSQGQGPTASAANTTSVSGTSSSSNSGTASGNLKPTRNLETDIRSVVDTVKPAVVLIAVTTPQAQGVGTGSIITPDGFILTNFHVVATDAATVSSQTKIQVVMTDGKKYPGTVVGTDRANDLAVVKIEATGLPTIQQGSSAALHVGDWVVAVGNALALPGGPTVTSGIVGALGRSIQEPPPAGADLTDLIQTSAAINPGNSGGPLLNLNGEIVGINTAAPVDQQSGGAAQGIGFAISIDQAKPIIQTLMSGKSIVSPYMGILPQTLTPGLAAQYNLPTDTGVLIAQVGPATPAEKAGWKAGDIITELDGTKLTSVADLQSVLNRHQPGDTVQGTLITLQGKPSRPLSPLVHHLTSSKFDSK